MSRAVKNICDLRLLGIVFGAVLLAIVSWGAQAATNSFSEINSTQISASEYVSAANWSEFAYFAHTSKAQHVVSSISEKLPCTMVLRCSSSNCTGAFLSENHAIGHVALSNTRIAASKLLRTGSDLPPPIGPPRRIS